MVETIQLTIILPAAPQAVYTAWLNSREHSAFTGSPAQIDPLPGGKFMAWDGYIQGRNLALEPYQRITQFWRTTEFPEDSPDSRLEVILEAVEGGTKLTLVHTEIPDGQSQSYYAGWEDYYFKPMMEYFSKAGKL